MALWMLKIKFQFFTQQLMDSLMLEISSLRKYEADLLSFLNSNHAAVLEEIRNGAMIKGDVKDKLHSNYQNF